MSKKELDFKVVLFKNDKTQCYINPDVLYIGGIKLKDFINEALARQKEEIKEMIGQGIKPNVCDYLTEKSIGKNQLRRKILKKLDKI